MFDPNNPEDLKMAHLYQAEMEQAMRDHPHVGVGMSVEVLSVPHGGTVLYEGRIVRMDWSKKYNMYEAWVRLGYNDYKIFIECLRRSRGTIREVFVNLGTA